MAYPHRDLALLVLVLTTTSGASAQLGSTSCSSGQNSTEAPARIGAAGRSDAVWNDLAWHGSYLPPDSFESFLVRRTRGARPSPGSPTGLCVGGTVGRFSNAALRPDSAGRVELALDLGALPFPTGSVAAINGDALHFQLLVPRCRAARRRCVERE